MAKFGRYDPRNKKNGRNKRNSLERDLNRIKEDKKKPTRQLREVAYDDQYDIEPPQQLNG